MVGRPVDDGNTAQQMLDLSPEFRNVYGRPRPVDEYANLTASTDPLDLFPCTDGAVAIAYQSTSFAFASIGKHRLEDIPGRARAIIRPRQSKALAKG